MVVQYLKYRTDGCGYKGRQLAIPRSRMGNYVRAWNISDKLWRITNTFQKHVPLCLQVCWCSKIRS
jgi:hypothetical protein